MKVKHAAAVLSKTVAKCIEDELGFGNEELVKFIRLINDWFDCLNGAFSTHGTKTRNPNLDPYRSEDDPRFKFLEDVLQYLSDWKELVHAVENAMNLTESFSGQPEVPNCEIEGDLEIAEEGNQPGEERSFPAKKKLLSAETMDGIEFTTISFISCVKFLLREGVQYVNPRVFSQDHIEQHFSKQRHRGSGSSNPNKALFLRNNVNIHLQGQLGVRKRKGNTEDLSKGMQITGTPLVKRKRLKPL